jgi:cobalamin synthase
VQRSRWTTPVLGLVIGLIALAVQAARGDLGGGVGSLVIMAVYAAFLLALGGRNEMVSLLRGGPGDERAGQIQQRALAMTAQVLVPVLVAGFLVELARGADDLPVWTWLCSLAGVVYLLALGLLSRRS